jgi:hypothetical protein
MPTQKTAQKAVKKTAKKIPKSETGFPGMPEAGDRAPGRWPPGCV